MSPPLPHPFSRLLTCTFLPSKSMRNPFCQLYQHMHDICIDRTTRLDGDSEANLFPPPCLHMFQHSMDAVTMSV